MKVALIGTCRLGGIRHHFACTDFDEAISFTHSTKEILQLLRFITKQIDIPDSINRFCFRRSILNHQSVLYTEKIMTQFNEADLFVIEICARKKYVFQGYIMHHLAVDKRLHYYRETPDEILKETTVVYQEDHEISQDIDEIIRLVHPRKVLLVSHVNAVVDAASSDPTVPRLLGRLFSFVKTSPRRETTVPELTPLKGRAELIQLIGTLAQEKGIPFFDPTIVLQHYHQTDILQNEAPGLPPGHYTDFGEKAAARMIAAEIGQIMAKRDEGITAHQ